MIKKLLCKLFGHKTVRLYHNKGSKHYDLHCSRCKKVLGKKFHVMDINSMYPYTIIRGNCHKLSAPKDELELGFKRR